MKFHDWLKKVKGFSDKEIEGLGFNARRYIRVSKQYLKWMKDRQYAYSVKIFSTRMKKEIIEFLSSFSLQERTLMSLGGVDPKTIYSNIRRTVKCEGGLGFLLFKKTTLIGVITAYKLNKTVAALDLLAIKPSEQRKGYGKFLLSYLFEVVKINGMKEIRGKVLEENDKAISFWKKLDFIFAVGNGNYLIRKSLVSSTD